MTEENKQQAEFKITKRWVLNTTILILVIIIVVFATLYFIETITHALELNAINNILSKKGEVGEPYKWRMILFSRLSSVEEPLNMRNVIIGMAGALTLVFAWKRLMIADQQKDAQVKQTESHIRQTETQIRQTESYIEQTKSRVKQTETESDRRLGERFGNAVDALSKKLDESSFPAHLGAISSLCALAIDSPKNTQRCLDIICSCNQWMDGYMNEFIEAGSRTPYSALLLNEDNRIANKKNKDKITILHEKRSQEALVAINNILGEISTADSNQLKSLKFHNKMLCGISLSNIKLDCINFRNTYLVAASLNRTSLKQAKLTEAHLEGASLINAHLEKAFLRNAHLERASLRRAHLERASLLNTHLEGASLRSAHLEEAKLGHAHLEGASLEDTHLEGASLRSANLEGASLYYANLEGASLDYANLEGASLDYAHLEGTSLRSTHLEGASLRRANLEGASLRNTRLEGALLINTQLQGASLNNVDLSNAMLLNCNLYGVTLKNINSRNIIFNEIIKIGYTKSKKTRKNFLDEICQHIKSFNQQMEAGKVKYFKQQMKAAWLAMDNNLEPDGLDIMRNSSISPLDKKGKYNISKKNLANLKKIWKERIKEKGLEFLLNMRRSISSMGRDSLNYYWKTQILEEDD